MNLRLAKINDLPRLKMMYEKIICNMVKHSIKIWDEVYPCEYFQQDIENNKLYILTENTEIVAAFALCETNDGEDYVQWKDVKANAIYIDRLGINTNYLRQGIGGLILKEAIELAKQNGFKYLRLFVVDINKPAINLYLKNGFTQVDGIYEERIDHIVLCEYGFEIET